MQEEFNALQKQGTWDLVPSTLDQRIIGCKGVFKVKRDSSGKNIEI